ncbi:MAG: cation-translocating P-type ATPase [Bacteriovoracaceae bacterium]
MQAWAQSVDKLVSKLKTNIKVGLTSAEAQEILAEYGPNSIVVKKKTPAWIILARQFKNPVIYILIIASGIAFFLKEILDGWAILAIVVLNSIIGFVQELKAESSIDALESMSSPKAKVLRDSHITTIDSKNVCPGDILVLEAGDYVAADARLISTRQLSCDESILTGESLAVEKQAEVLDSKTILAERTNMTYAGTAIVTGTGRGIVVGTGKNTEIGKIAQLMDDTVSEITPLQKRLEKVSHVLLILGIVVILSVALIGIWREWTWTEIIMTSLSISIAAIPEGLPTVVTIALVMAIRRMASKKALVRKMHSVETLGTTDIICTDKTGTLTTGKMTVHETLPKVDKNIYEKIMILCNNASLENGGVGDTTEIALLDYAQKNGIDIGELKDLEPRQWEWSFESNRKRMSVAVRAGDQDLIYTKGAPEAILKVCNTDDSLFEEITKKADEYSGKGMRVLAFAYKEVNPSDYSSMKTEEAESNLIFAGLVAITDPPREESKEAVKKCIEAGIRVIMITGDHPRTAAAIAQEIGIHVNPSRPVLTGAEMDSLSEEEFLKAVKEVSVYARVSPENKLHLVNVLKDAGFVVAMTGDGVNDALALKAASIGVAMGKGGTEVARQASSMILTDDNFATIVDAVEEGRAVNGNIKRTLQYLLSTNLAELLFILLSTMAGMPIPLLPINILWINLVTDGLPSLALAAESVPPHYLEESRKPTAKSFFDQAFFVEMIVSGFFITVLGIGLYYYSLQKYDLLTGRSYAFTFFVYAQIFRSFANRSESKTFLEMRPNYYHLWACAIPLICQIIIQQFDILLDIFNMKALTLNENLALLAISLVPVSALEIVKFFRSKNKK